MGRFGFLRWLEEQDLSLARAYCTLLGGLALKVLLKNIVHARGTT